MPNRSPSGHLSHMYPEVWFPMELPMCHVVLCDWLIKWQSLLPPPPSPSPCTLAEIWLPGSRSSDAGTPGREPRAGCSPSARSTAAQTPAETKERAIRQASCSPFAHTAFYAARGTEEASKEASLVTGWILHHGNHCLHQDGLEWKIKETARCKGRRQMTWRTTDGECARIEQGGQAGVGALRTDCGRASAAHLGFEWSTWESSTSTSFKTT